MGLGTGILMFGVDISILIVFSLIELATKINPIERAAPIRYIY